MQDTCVEVTKGYRPLERIEIGIVTSSTSLIRERIVLYGHSERRSNYKGTAVVTAMRFIKLLHSLPYKKSNIGENKMEKR